MLVRVLVDSFQGHLHGTFLDLPADNEALALSLVVAVDETPIRIRLKTNLAGPDHSHPAGTTLNAPADISLALAHNLLRTNHRRETFAERLTP